jgi:hypothetical protein
MANKRFNYYCADEIAEHIDIHATHLEFTKDSFAAYLVLLAVKDLT